jgi:hypothetical protein
MTKKAQVTSQEVRDLINVDFTVPPNTAKKFGIEKLNLQLNAPVIEQARVFVDELKLARSLPNDPGDITLADPLAIFIMSVEPELEGSDVLKKAEFYYQQYIADVNRESFILAMTMFNDDIAVDPEEYVSEERKETLRGKGGVPIWLSKIPEVPKPKRRIFHKYERRLKQILDLLNQGGQEDPIFLASFNRVINNDLTSKMRELGVSVNEPVDADGFPENTPDS